MSVQAMRNSLQRSDAYLSTQIVSATHEELDALAIEFEASDVDRALREAGPIATAKESELELAIDMPAGRVELVAQSGGFWRNINTNVRVTSLVPELANEHERVSWPIALIAQPSVIQAPVQGVLRIDKAGWRSDVEAASQRTVWMGRRLEEFEAWLLRQPWRTVCEALFAEYPGAAVLTEDWLGAPKACGPLLFSSTTSSIARSKSDDVLLDRLGADGGAVRAVWRATAIECSQPVPLVICRQMRGVASIASAWALSDIRGDSEIRFRHDDAATLRIPSSLAFDELQGGGIRALASWVQSSPDRMKLDVARHVAIQRVDRIESEMASGEVVLGAELAHAVVIRDTVSEALEKQIEFEATFLSLDGRVAATREAIVATVDQAVVRALTASLAIGVASLTSAKVRGTPALIAALLLAGYLLATVVFMLTSTKTDAMTRLDDAKTEIAGRRTKLGSDLGGALETRLKLWRSSIESRITRSAILLSIVAIAVTTAGIAFAPSRGASTSEAQQSTPKPTPSP